MLEKVAIEISTEDLRLLSTEFEFPDGSVMHNAFSNTVTNEAVDEALFDLEVGDDWTVIEPLTR